MPRFLACRAARASPFLPVLRWTPFLRGRICPAMQELTLSSQAVRLIYPVLAMVLLSFMMLATLGALRLSAAARQTYPRGYFKTMKAPADAELPRRPEAVA